MAKEAAQQQDQSMEEILQSIKRIIAEEGEEESGTAAEPAAKQEEQPAAAPAPAPASAADDVLELTDVVDEDGVGDAMMEEPETPASAPSPQVSAPVSAQPAESLLEVVDRDVPAAAHKDVLDDIDNLLSQEAAQASAKALRSIPAKPAPQAAPHISTPSMPFRAGGTVEDLVMEALRPMLKDWLNNNLPGIVEQLVEREIKKISHQ